MRKTIPSLFLILIIVGSLFPLLPVYAEDPEPSGAWDNRYSYKLDYGNGTYTSTFSLGPQVFWNGLGWQELKFEDLGNGYLLENSLITAYVYDWYTVFYDPDNQRVAVDDERWIVEVYNEKKEKWREVDLYAPSLSYSNNATHLTVTRNFDCAEGELNVTYILWQGSRLKHDVSFKSGIEENQQFRVIMKLTGIYSDKVKHSAGTELITSEKHIISPFFVFGEDNDNLVFSEYLWSLGEFNVISEFNETSEEWFNVTTDEWMPITLKDVVLGISAQGSKMDIIIGNYTLAENESLLIDPDSNTWLIGQSSDDANNEKGSFSLVRPTPAFNHYSLQNNYDRTGIRWTNIAIPSGSTISSAYVSVKSAFNEVHTDATNNHIYGSDEDDAATFSTLVDLDGRSLTSTYALWYIPKMGLDIWYNSPEIDTEIQEIIDRDNWESGNDLAVIFFPMSRSSRVLTKIYSYDNAPENAPKLTITWEAAGGVEYYRYTAQTISWTGSNSREWTLSRILTQGLTFSSDSSRTWSLSRAFTQTLTFTSNALVDLLEFIQETASIGLTFSSDSNREWSLKRVLSQGLIMTSSGNRMLSAVRTSTQSLTATMSASRTWDLSRTVSQTITFASDALADLMKFFERTASLALSLVSDSSRSWTLQRALSQGFTMTLNSNRVFTTIRGVTQSLTATLSVGRTWDLSRTVSQSITFTSNALADLLSVIQRTASVVLNLVSSSGREWSLKRGFSQGLTLVSNGERMLGAFRTASQSLTATMNANRIWSTVREVSQSLTTTLNANRIFTAVRTASQSLTTTLNGNRVFNAIRSASQTLTASISASRTWDLSRTASQAITFTSNALADLMKFFERTASLALSLVSDSSRSWTLKRILAQSMTFVSNVQAELIQGFTYFHRYVSMALNLALDSKRTWGISRNVSQTITFASSALGDLLEFFSRSVSLTLNFVSSVIARTQMWLLSLFVTDFDDIPLENATVALTRNNSEATSYWKTYANGSIPDLLLSPDDYFLMISKYNYLTNETWVSLTGNYTLGILMEGAWIETNPEILGLFGVCLILQLCYAYGLYKGTQPTLTLTAGVLTALSWYTTGQVVLSFNQVQGVPIALLLSGFSTVNVVLLFRIVYALMMHYQEA